MVVLLWSDSLTQTVFKSFINFWCGTPWTLNHSVHCTCAMEMSWESNRVVLPWSDSLCQTAFKSFMNFWCGTPLDTQSLSTLHMCNGNVLSIQSGSTTVIWFTLPDSFQKTFSQPSFLGYFYTNQITLLKLSPTMDPTAAGLQWLRIIWLGFLRRRCPRAQQPLLCSQGSHEHPMKWHSYHSIIIHIIQQSFISF